MEWLPQAVRLRKIISGELPDRVPNFEFFFDNPAVRRHFLGHEPQGGLEEQAEFTEAIGWGSMVSGWFAIRIGARSEVASDGTSHYAGGSPLTWELLRGMRDPDFGPGLEKLHQGLEAAHSRGLMAHCFVLHCFHSAATGLGLERLALMCYDEFDLLKAYMERVEAHNQRAIQAMVEQGCVPDFIVFDGDCSFKNAMMVRPETYRELVFDCTCQTCREITKAGIPYLFHTDGKVDRLYPILIELGFSGAHGVEAQANDLGEIKRLFGDRFTLFGNMDPVFLAWSSPEEVYEATVEMVRTGKPGGRYGAAVNTIVSDYTPLENYLAFLEAIRDVGEYNGG